MDPITEKETGTTASAADAPDDQDLLVTEPQAEGAEPTEPERDPYDDLLDNDPDFRQQVKEQIRRFAEQGYQSQQQSAPQAPDELQELTEAIQQNDQWLEQFFDTPEEQRNYEEYERRKLKQIRLQGQKQELVLQRQQQNMALSQADGVVDAWIAETIRREAARYGESDLKNYQARVRELARNLPAHIRADEQTLRRALEEYIEPNAFKEYQRDPKRRAKRRPAGSGNDYTDDTPDERPVNPNDKYADASDEEREFLRSVGLLEEKKDEQRGLIPTQDGYIIPVGRGRRNEGNQ